MIGIRWHIRDGITWCIYCVTFTVLFFGLNVAFSPGQSSNSVVAYNTFDELLSPDEMLSSTESPISTPTTATQSTSKEKTVVKNTPKQQPTLSVEMNPTSLKVEGQKVSTLRNVAYAKPFQQKVLPLTLLFDGTRSEPRGQLSHATLIIMPKVALAEQTKVFVHELGHVVDIRHLVSGTFSSDSSETFYKISWQDYNVKKKGAVLSDFVSGYALTNKYEDFAESFTFFVFHNDTFKARAQKSIALAAKYDFLHEQVFGDNSFTGLDFMKDTKVPDYIWDTTKVAINMKKYLFYIK